MTDVSRGCLALADISGYTTYLGGVELEHSHDVLADLLDVVTTRLGSVLRVVKLEGDAVFAIEHGRALDGALLLDAVDACYGDFARRKRTIAMRSTCTCDACARTPDLDLKFLVHSGEWVEHRVAGGEELVGRDVIVAHRLLKNSVEGEGYLLLTDAAAGSLGIDASAAGFANHGEAFEDVGQVHGWVRDLGARFAAEEERSPVLVEPEDADLEYVSEARAAPPEVWAVLTEPERQHEWRVGLTAYESSDPPGARGIGTTAHCIHGRETHEQEILDLRPFERYTYRERNPVGRTLWTFTPEPLDAGGTRITLRIALTGGRAQRAAWLLTKRPMRKAVTTNFDSLIAALS